MEMIMTGRLDCNCGNFQLGNSWPFLVILGLLK